jgi:hypothetical protein
VRAPAPPLVRVVQPALPAAAFARLRRAVVALGTENLRDGYQTTFWFDLGRPASLVEEAILLQRGHYPRRIAGFEWWLSRMRTSDVKVDFHQDCDERLGRRGGPLVHPAQGSVLFLNRCRGGLLAVTEAPPDDANPARAPDDLSRLDLVRPWPNRLALFRGDATHGVLDADGRIPTRHLTPAQPLRLAIAINAWARRPTGVPEFARSRRYAALRLPPR